MCGGGVCSSIISNVRLLSFEIGFLAVWFWRRSRRARYYLHSRRAKRGSRSKPAHVPNRREKTQARNPMEPAKEAILLRPGHPCPFSPEHPSSCVMRVLLWGLTKKLFLERAHVQPQDVAPRPHAACSYGKQPQLPPISN